MASWRTLLMVALLFVLTLLGCWYGGILGPIAPGPKAAQAAWHCTAPPAHNLYACTMPTPLTTYAPGHVYFVTPSVTNTGPVVVSLSGLPPRPLMRVVGIEALQGLKRRTLRKGQTIAMMAVPWSEALVLVDYPWGLP